MKTSTRTILTIAVLCLYGFAFVGCNSNSAGTASTPVSSGPDDDHDHDHDEHAGHDHDGDDHDHDHDEHAGHDHDGDDHDHDQDEHAGHDHDDSHAGHDHAAHGPNGGHMVELAGGAHAEWAHDDETDLITVYAEKPETVTKVEMKTTIAGKETVYSFEQKEADGKATYQLTSPELLTAVKMGAVVDTKLVITTEEGESSGQVKHHAH